MVLGVARTRATERRTVYRETVGMRPRTTTQIRVATVPEGHVYVRHLDAEMPPPGLDPETPFAATEADHLTPRIARLRDPDPDDPRRSAQSRWWPPAMLEPAWVRDNLDFDIMHLQFGFDARTPAQLAEWTDALRDTGRPLVYTVHDLRNPHHLERAEHDAQLDVLIPRADALITLTPGAANEIRSRWDREAIVIPHPHVVDFATMARVADERPQRTGAFRVGVHVKSLRASMDPLPVLRALVDVLRGIPDAVLQINGHTDVLDPAGARFEPELAAFVRHAAATERVELHVHDFLDDDALWAYLASLDVSVLPYRFGTHSGWLEACRDLGTTVVAPDVGYYREQGPVVSYRMRDEGPDAASLGAAIRRAHDGPRSQAATVDERRAQRADIAAAHASIYTGLLP